TALPSLAWSHRKIPPLHQLEREESRLVIRGNPQNRICKKIALQRPKTGKFDYLSEPNHPAHSMAFKFFTDDWNSGFNFTITPFEVGPVSAVPGPIAGAGLPSRIFAGGGLLGWWRRHQESSGTTSRTSA